VAKSCANGGKMISDEDRVKIVERIRAENEIRRELADCDADGKKSRWFWIESKLGLLVIGALLTGVLVPTFQATQETIKWARQNRYDNLKYRIEAARSAMKELTITHAYVAEACERVKVFTVYKSEDDKNKEEYKSQFLEMHNRRFQQNARFVGTLGLIDEKDREVIQNLFNDYLSSVQQLVTTLEMIAGAQIRSRKDADSNNIEKLKKAEGSLSKDVDTFYERTLKMLTMYLHRLEVQSENYF
jgi:hypothetical protein